MVKKLLVLSDNEGYYRFSSGNVERCSMEKAAVFAITSIEEVKKKQAELIGAGYKDATIKLLTITEENYVE